MRMNASIVHAMSLLIVQIHLAASRAPAFLVTVVMDFIVKVSTQHRLVRSYYIAGPVPHPPTSFQLYKMIPRIIIRERKKMMLDQGAYMCTQPTALFTYVLLLSTTYHSGNNNKREPQKFLQEDRFHDIA